MGVDVKARDIVGKKVIAIHQSFWTKEEGCHTPCWCVERIEFEDGTTLVLSTVEGESGYGVEGTVYKRRKQ